MTIPADIDPDTERAARAFIAKVVVLYDFAGAILFGSRARHTNLPDSDADIAVILHGHPGKFVVTKLEMADIAYDTLLETGIRIQPLPIWEEEWAHPETYSNPLLLRNIEREGMRL
jgi:predicted nucleotidyltransferase